MLPAFSRRFVLALGVLVAFFLWRLLDTPVLHGVRFASGAGLVAPISPWVVVTLVLATLQLSLPSVFAFGCLVTHLREVNVGRKDSRLATWGWRIGFSGGLLLLGHVLLWVATSLGGGLRGLLTAPAAEAATALDGAPGALVVAAAYAGARVTVVVHLVTYFVMLCGGRPGKPESTGIPWRWVRWGGLGLAAGLGAAGWVWS